MASLFKGAAWVFGVLGVIGSFVLANQAKGVLNATLNTVAEVAPNFDPVILLMGLISTALAFLLFYGVSELFANQEKIIAGQKELFLKIESTVSKPPVKKV